MPHDLRRLERRAEGERRRAVAAAQRTAEPRREVAATRVGRLEPFECVDCGRPWQAQPAAPTGCPFCGGARRPRREVR